MAQVRLFVTCGKS